DEKEFVLPIHQRKTVRSSSGHSEDRYFIQTILRIFDENLTVILSLTDRSDMKYPVLIGRKLLQKRFVVDVSRTNLSARGKIIRCELKRSSSK
ncbi:MAG: RimK/LysX family protein, partial [Calditrichia bacterium]